MSDRHNVSGFGDLDMQDPAEIRRYIRWFIAHTHSPTSAMLQRIEMMDEMATKLEDKHGAKRASLYAVKSDEPIDDAFARLAKARTAERESNK